MKLDTGLAGPGPGPEPRREHGDGDGDGDGGGRLRNTPFRVPPSSFILSLSLLLFGLVWFGLFTLVILVYVPCPSNVYFTLLYLFDTLYPYNPRLSLLS